MALSDRSISSEQYVEMACGTENLSPYSSPAGFTDPPSYYATDYEWQQQAVQQTQHLPLAHQPGVVDPDKIYYATYPEGTDLGYAAFGHQPVVHSDCYNQAHGLWPTNSPTDSLVSSQIAQQHRYFSGIDLSQQSISQQTGPATGPNGKPKRKRVQSHSQRKAANVRERRRMFHLNEAFDELRKRLPAFNYEKRLSRIETLRLAMTYISFMKEVSTGRDPKCVKLKPHGSDLSALTRGGGGLLPSHSSFSGSDNNDDNLAVHEDSDCSNDELSNHSGGN